MSNLNEEVSIKLVGKLTLLLPFLEQKLDMQLEVKKVIDETLYSYEVQTKCTDLVCSDIEEKSQLYLACKKLEGLSNKTLYNYRLFLNKLDQYFTKPCSTINTMDLRLFLALLGKGKQASTINWSEQSIKVVGKGSKERIVYFSTKAKLHIQQYISTRKGESNYLFISEKAPYQAIGTRALQLIIKKIKDRTNVTERVHAHKFRRTQATRLLNSGMRIEGVQGILGHTTPTTTQIYAQLSQENLKNEYRRLVV